MDAAPEADSGSPDNNDSGGIDHQEDGRASSTVNSVLYTLTHVLLFAARLPQTHNGTTKKTHTGILGHTVALGALSSVIVL